jgi:hypothetical protein
VIAESSRGVSDQPVVQVHAHAADVALHVQAREACTCTCVRLRRSAGGANGVRYVLYAPGA